MKSFALYLLIFSLLFVYTNNIAAQVEFVEESKVTNEGLYFWYANGKKAYQYSPHISPKGGCFTVANGYIFFGWYQGGMAKRDLMISRKKIGSRNWVTVKLPHKNTFVGNGFGDSHRTISVQVSTIDNTLHIIFDHHNDPLNYIVSKKNKAFVPDHEFKADIFYPKRGYLAVGENVRITYPKLLRNADGKLVLAYRKGSAIGGNEMVHVYDGKWTKAKMVLRGSGDGIKEADKNYAYGNAIRAGDDIYYAFSVRWKRKKSQGVLNEGVYLANCGPTMLDPWIDLKGKKHSLPIRDFSPFLVDMPKTNGKGSGSGIPGSGNANGDIHLMYMGRGNYNYTYTRKAGDTSFTKHADYLAAGGGWGDRFYSNAINSAGRITIQSTPGGEIDYTFDTSYETGRSFGAKVVKIIDGYLVIMAQEKLSNTDKKPIYCYVFKLPDLTPTDGGRGGRGRRMN